MLATDVIFRTTANMTMMSLPGVNFIARILKSMYVPKYILEGTAIMTDVQTASPGQGSTQRLFRSRRDLTGIARSIADKFSVSVQHYAWLARKHGTKTVTIDLLTPRISPAPFDIERNQILADMCRGNLKELLRRLPPPAEVMSAELKAEFSIQDSADGEQSDTMGPTTVTVHLTDERGKKWLGVNRTEITLAQG